MNEAVVSFVTLAAAIAAPKEGNLRRNSPAERDTVIQSPAASPRNVRGADPAFETEEQRKERLIEAGVLQAPPPPPERDYLAVLTRRPEAAKSRPNLPPLLRFNLGFGSWFPLKETAGRESTPLGAHHVGALLWAWGGKSEGENGLDAAEVAYSSLSLFVMSTQAEISLDGYDLEKQETRYTVLANDLDTGIVYRRVLQWPLGEPSSAKYQVDLGLSLGYLPLRQRYIKQFGLARSKDRDFLRNGVQFNALGGVVQVSLSLVSVSLFEAGIFFGAVSSSPFQVKAWAGLEFALRMARQVDATEASLSAESSLNADAQSNNGKLLPKAGAAEEGRK